MYFKIFKIIRRHERQIHGQNKVNMEINTHDNGRCSTQQPQTLNTRETHTARAVAYITSVHVTFNSLLMATSLDDMHTD